MRSEAGGAGVLPERVCVHAADPGERGADCGDRRGIKKEVSVSCAVSRCVCSICGHDIHDRGLCSHVKGRTYEGKRCIARLADPTDAFEWSFGRFPPSPELGWSKASGSGHVGTAAVESGPRGPLAGGTEGPAAAGGDGAAIPGRAAAGDGPAGSFGRGGPGGETLRAIADRLEEPELERLRACYARRLEEKAAHAGAAAVRRGETGPEANDGSFVI